MHLMLHQEDCVLNLQRRAQAAWVRATAAHMLQCMGDDTWGPGKKYDASKGSEKKSHS